MPSENVEASTPLDRRARKRAARRDTLLEHAAAIVDREGLDGLTMAALAEAGDYATASLYTYFSSRSALVGALQQQALSVLAEVASEATAAWDEALAGTDPALAALARLWAFSDLFLTAPQHHPREFRLQQDLLVATGHETSEDASAVLPAAMAVLDTPRRLLQEAQDRGALAVLPPVLDPLGGTMDPATARTFAWVVALNGALLTDNLLLGLPTTGRLLGDSITHALLLGWGADADGVEAARAMAAETGWSR